MRGPWLIVVYNGRRPAGRGREVAKAAQGCSRAGLWAMPVRHRARRLGTGALAAAPESKATRAPPFLRRKDPLWIGICPVCIGFIISSLRRMKSKKEKPNKKEVQIMRFVKPRKKRGIKLSGDLSYDLCPCCYAPYCDPFLRPPHVEKRLRAGVCPACGTPTDQRSCRSSLKPQVRIMVTPHHRKETTTHRKPGFPDSGCTGACSSASRPLCPVVPRPRQHC